jgi:serine/threonine protein kinase
VNCGALPECFNSPPPPGRRRALDKPVQAVSKIPPRPQEAGYDCIKEIGSGGYGYVYLLTDRQCGSQPYVAGKFVHRHAFGLPGDAAAGEGYKRALEGLRNFRSVSIESEYLLRIFEVRERHEEGYFCYMMELADDIESGRNVDAHAYRPRTLKNELERSGLRKRLPAKQCIDIAIVLARGLQVLHESGFTHRDVRPSNIIFVTGVPKLADIDLLAGNDAALPSYIPKDYAAPEGCHSNRADIFSLGKTIYEMCTGLPVKSYPCLPADIRHWDDHLVLLRVNKVIARACARDLGKRYGAAREMLNDLERIAQK